MSKIITSDKYDDIVELYKNGKKQQEIASKYGVDQTTISDILRKLDITRTSNRSDKICLNDHDNIVAMYYDGMKQKEIAQLYGTTQQVIGNILRKHNVEPRTRISQSVKKQIIEAYLSGKTQQKIEELFGVQHQTIVRILKQNNIPLRDRHTACKTYSFDENYFDQIDTPNKAYILGMLYADGCVGDDGSIRLKLQCEDRNILEKINKELDNDRPLKFHNFSSKRPNRKDMFELTLHSKYVSDVLSKHGCFPRKSLKLIYPTWLPMELQRHFLRGYVDGDGSISKNPKKMSVSFVCTYKFAVDAVRIIQAVCNAHCYVFVSIKHNGDDDDTCTVSLNHKKDACSFLDWIYKDADLYMDRKHDIYDAIYSSKNINNTLN